MGVIEVNIRGSFPKAITRQFSAMHGGHAQAVAEAIEFLSREVLSNAIKHDHELHEAGAQPEIGFGKRFV